MSKESLNRIKEIAERLHYNESMSGTVMAGLWDIIQLCQHTAAPDDCKKCGYPHANDYCPNVGKEMLGDSSEISVVDDGHIAPEDWVTDSYLNKIESDYWTSDLPRYVHDMVATIRFLREREPVMSEQPVHPCKECGKICVGRGDAPTSNDGVAQSTGVFSSPTNTQVSVRDCVQAMRNVDFPDTLYQELAKAVLDVAGVSHVD